MLLFFLILVFMCMWVDVVGRCRWCRVLVDGRKSWLVFLVYSCVLMVWLWIVSCFWCSGSGWFEVMCSCYFIRLVLVMYLVIGCLICRWVFIFMK